MAKTFKAALAATFMAGAVAIAAPANAAIVIDYVDGASVAEAGYIVINQFNNNAGITGSGYLIKTGTDYQGAAPAFANPFGTSYLSVLAGGSASIALSIPVYALEFDSGSIDDYNTISGTTTTGSFSIALQGIGNQTQPFDNGIIRVRGTAGEQFTSITFASSQNSFEVDNLAVLPVPEPATWAMLICGFGLVGAAMRRRNTSSVVYA